MFVKRICQDDQSAGLCEKVEHLNTRAQQTLFVDLKKLESMSEKASLWDFEFLSYRSHGCG